MSGEDEAEKPYDPSQKRLEDARERGEIPYSADLTTAAGYGGFVVMAAFLGSATTLSLATGLSTLLDQSDRLSADVFSGGAGPLTGDLLLAVGWSLAPWFGLPAALALLAIFAQRGLTFAGTKLTFKLSRISPIAAIRGKFGLGGLVEFAKSVVKLLLYATVAVFLLRNRIEEIIGTAALGPGPGMQDLLKHSNALMTSLCLVALGIGLFDLVWQNLNHLRKNRMSRQELLDEMKDSEGDPATRQQRRARGVSLAMNRMLSDVPKADVVIVNPTHFAVALKWDRSSRQAPVCVAKGTDEIAARIREIASANAVPIRLDPPTARALHAGVEIGEPIPREHFRAVAAAIRFAEGLRKKAAR